MSPPRHDAVVIGSGFGGAILALRLSEAGRGVLVLERGRSYEARDFPRQPSQTDQLLWEPGRSRGLFDLRFHSGIATLTAAGLGGGSLVYASIHYRPRAAIFADPRWPRALNPESLEPYYARVAADLGVQAFPEEPRLAKRDAFHEAGRQLRRRVMDTPQAVSWRETFGAGEGRRPCQLCAECEFGCPHGAKNTLDYTHLARARAAGAQVQTGAEVQHISPAEGGGWEVWYRDLDSGELRSVVGRQVVLSAGTLGTNEILLRSRDQARSLPRLPAALGRGYSGNGDFLGNIQGSARSLEPWRGPDVTSVMWHDEEEPSFVLATPTFNQAVMEVLASHGQSTPGRLTRAMLAPLWAGLLPWLRRALSSGLLERALPMAAPGAGPADRMTTVFAIGRDDAGGRMLLREGRLDIEWDYASQNRALIERQRAAMAELARAYGGTYADFPLWGLFDRTLTVHNLGGCAISEDPSRGVVGLDGQIHGHPGLHVADGSVIPTAVGSHPVMTISAVAEWIAERAVAAP